MLINKFVPKVLMGKKKIGEISYGVYVTDLPNGSDCVYMKVNKRPASDCVSVNHTRNYCVVVNLKYGTLRQIPGDTPVTPLTTELSFEPLEPRQHHLVEKSRY